MTGKRCKGRYCRTAKERFDSQTAQQSVDRLPELGLFWTRWNWQAPAGVVIRSIREAIMWRDSTPRADALRSTGEDEAAYVAGWTISGLATLGAILAVWIFAV
jgi:hypothetical protein